MDRVTVFPGQLPLETDLLKTGQNAMVAVGKIAEAVFGTADFVDGFGLTPTAPASLSVVLSPGQCYQVRQIEQAQWSSLGVDVRQVLKQGLSLDAVALTLAPPTTVNYSCNVLVQVQYSDSDSDAVVRPFYNAANPSAPFSGPGNNGQPSSQTRKGTVSVQTKYGQPSTTGTQVTPTPDAGWNGIYVVTLSFGQTAITQGNIAPYVAAPVIPTKLQNIPNAIQNGLYTYVIDQSQVANTILIAPTPALKTYGAGTAFRIIPAFTNTSSTAYINASGLGNRLLVRRDGSPLAPGDIVAGLAIDVFDDGTRFRLNVLGQQEATKVASSGAPTIYVRTDGNDDAQDGSQNTAASAFKTIQAAYNKAVTVYGTGQTVTIQLGTPGSYAPPMIGIKTAGYLIIRGDPTNPTGYVITGNSGGRLAILQGNGAGQIDLIGLHIQNIGGSQNTISYSASIYLRILSCFLNMTSGAACTGWHVTAGDGAVIGIGVDGTPGSVACQFTGSMAGLVQANGGVISIGNPYVVNGTPAFSIATAYARSAGRIYVAPGATASGSATGTRALAVNNGLIDTGGQGQGVLPGNANGTPSNGGIIV